MLLVLVFELVSEKRKLQSQLAKLLIRSPHDDQVLAAAANNDLFLAIANVAAASKSKVFTVSPLTTIQNPSAAWNQMTLLKQANFLSSIQKQPEKTPPIPGGAGPCGSAASSFGPPSPSPGTSPPAPLIINPIQLKLGL